MYKLYSNAIVIRYFGFHNKITNSSTKKMGVKPCAVTIKKYNNIITSINYDRKKQVMQAPTVISDID